MTTTARTSFFCDRELVGEHMPDTGDNGDDNDDGGINTAAMCANIFGVAFVRTCSAMLGVRTSSNHTQPHSMDLN